jgi:hypothetical protein
MNKSSVCLPVLFGELGPTVLHADLELNDLVDRAANLEHYGLLSQRFEVRQRRIQELLFMGEGREKFQVHAPVHETLRANPQQGADGPRWPLGIM